MAVVSVTNGVLNISSQDEVQQLSQELSNVMLDNLTDVNIISPVNGQALVYNSANSEWENSTLSFDLINDTTPQLGGDLDPNGFNIVGNGGLSLKSTQSHQFLRATTNDNNGVLQFGKDTSGLNESLLLKALIAFRAHNTANQYTIAHIYGERLSDANPSRQLVLGLYTDAGARTDILRISRDSGSVDTVNMLAGLNTQAITAVGNVSITGSINQSGAGVDLTSTSTGVNITSSTTVDLTATNEVNIDAFKVVTNAPMDMTVDNITTSIPNAVLMNTLCPVTKDIANFMSGYMDYQTAGLPTQTQATFTFGVKQTGSGNPDIIAGRLVNTYTDSTGDTGMQLRAYEPGTTNHSDLAVTRAKAYSTVPFQFPSFTTTERNALTPSAGWVLFNTTDTKLQVYDGTSWVDLH